MSLNPPGQEPLLWKGSSEVPSAQAISLQELFFLSKQRHQREGLRWLFPSLLQALPSSPARGSPGPPALPPSAMATCPGAHSSFTSSTTCCSPQVSILLSHSQSAARKLGLIILGLVHVNVPFLPQERKKLQSPVVTSHRLWLLPGVDPSLGGWGPNRGKFLQDSSACAYGEGPLILCPQRIDILH